MNVLAFDKRVQVVSALVDGVSIRATERMTGVNRETVMFLGVDVGEGCWRLHEALVQGLQVNVLEFDEIWAFIGKKQRRVRPQESTEFGDCYTFIALDATKKAIISYLVGKRDQEHTDAFAADVRARILNKPQITSDGYQPYIDAIARAFGYDVDYAQILKTYRKSSEETEDRRYSPPRCVASVKRPIRGEPDRGKISTSYVERQNLTVRMGCRRFTRLTNAFSKKLRNHAAAVALYVAHYNFCRVHETIRRTPMMALGVTDHVWSIAELIDAALSTAPDSPGPTPALPPIRPILPPMPPPAGALPAHEPERHAEPVPVATLQRAVAVIHQLSLFPEAILSPPKKAQR